MKNNFDIHEWQAKFLKEDNSKNIVEGKIAIRTYKGGPKDSIGYVDTALIDQLVGQIGPHIGYSDWQDKVQLSKQDYEQIIEKIAKHLTGHGPLQSDRVEFI